MRRITTVSAAAAVSTLILVGCSSTATQTSTSPSTTTTASASASTTASTTDDTTPAMVAAAEAFLATLTDDQKTSVSFEFSDTAQRQRWSNLPQGLFDRAGLMWGDLSTQSQDAWLALMHTTMSTEGYERVRAEWAADDQLSSGGSNSYGMQYYWVALIGTPSTTEAWQWQWGGHHVTVNATIKGSDLSLTPSFIGAQPTSYDANGAAVKPLGDILDEAAALVTGLDDTQKAKAVLGSSYIDLVLGPGEDGRTIEAEGVAGADLTDAQKEQLLTIIGEYGNLENAEDGAARMQELEADLDSTYFAWYGPTDTTEGVYFRITGPKVVIEYSNQSMGGDPADHVHGIYRDPTDDYGAAFGAGL